MRELEFPPGLNRRPFKFCKFGSNRDLFKFQVENPSIIIYDITSIPEGAFVVYIDLKDNTIESYYEHEQQG